MDWDAIAGRIIKKDIGNAIFGCGRVRDAAGKHTNPLGWRGRERSKHAKASRAGAQQ